MSEQYSPFLIRAIIGLGNPGFQYYKTRHNIGFRVVDALTERYHASWNESELMQHTQILMPGEGETRRPVFLIKPLTFMNNSGKVLPFLLKKGIDAREILVIHDELEKPFGTLVVRWNGGARGHNGLRSIEGIIGKQFWRLCFGIGRPEDRNEIGNYVLSPFETEQESKLDNCIERALLLIEQDKKER